MQVWLLLWQDKKKEKLEDITVVIAVFPDSYGGMKKIKIN